MIPFAPSKPQKVITYQAPQHPVRHRIPETIEENSAPSESGSESGNPRSKLRDVSRQDFRCLKGEILKHFSNMGLIGYTEIQHLDVKQYKYILKKDVMPFTVRKVVSPFEFYVEMDFDGDNCILDFKKLHARMQKYYADGKVPIAHPYPDKGVCYACKDFNDGEWYRVRIYNINKKTRTATVFYCDMGKFQEARFEDIKALQPQFVASAAQLFRAYLYDVIPTDNTLEWSDEATDYFKKMVVGKKLDGIVMARSDSLVNKDAPEIYANLGMVLIDRPNIKQEDKSCTINAQLVDNGYAIALGVFSGCKHQLMPKELQYPTIDKEEMIKLYPKPPQPPPTQAPALAPMANMSLIFGNTDYRHLMPPRDAWLPKKYLLESKKDSHCPLPEKMAERLVRIKLSYCIAPNFLIVQTFEERQKMQEMQEGIQRAVKDEAAPKEFYPGMFVACEVSDNTDSTTTIARYCRGVVKQIMDNNKTIKLLLVDYGNEITVKRSACYKLPTFFEQIPSFAHRVHLDSTGIIPGGQMGWSYDAGYSFKKYLHTWEVSKPKYYLFRPQHTRCIEVNDFNQEISYSSTEKRWIAGPEKNLNVNKPINELKSHPLIASLYHSLGVEIWYEVFVGENPPFWFFNNLCESLVSSGHARYKRCSKGADLLHLDIINKLKETKVEVEAPAHLQQRLQAGKMKNGLSSSNQTGASSTSYASTAYTTRSSVSDREVESTITPCEDSTEESTTMDEESTALDDSDDDGSDWSISS